MQKYQREIDDFGKKYLASAKFMLENAKIKFTDKKYTLIVNFEYDDEWCRENERIIFTYYGSIPEVFLDDEPKLIDGRNGYGEPIVRYLDGTDHDDFYSKMMQKFIVEVLKSHDKSKELDRSELYFGSGGKLIEAPVGFDFYIKMKSMDRRLESYKM